MKPSFVVLLRDVSPSSWSACLRVMQAVREVAPVPLTLLVAPRYRGEAHDAAFDRGLGARVQAGDELVLHGYMHLDDMRPRDLADRLQRRWHHGSAEFRSLRCDDALQRLHAGVRWFSANGWPLAGFAAPCWTMGPGTWAALKLTPFVYTLTRDALYALQHEEAMPSYSVRYGHGAWARHAALAWHACPGRLGQDGAMLVRLELSPGDADHAPVRRAWQRCIERHLSYRHAMTVARTVAAWQPALPQPAGMAAGVS